MKTSLASDNTSGIHPRILEALQKANTGWSGAYGDDEITGRLQTLCKSVFGPKATGFPVWNGTGGNVTALATLLKPFQAVIAAETSHLNIDECGSLERFAGVKVITVPHSAGKITPAQIQPFLHFAGDPHHVQPRIISISQTTEYGTTYKPEEIRKLATFAHQNGMLLHMDGARFTQAAVSLGGTFQALTADLGVDALTFGGTKHGLLCGELVVFFDRPEAQDFPFVRKQGMQLASKMRFISAQLYEFIETGLWKENATRAHAMASRLHQAIRDRVEIPYPVEANAVFAVIPERTVTELLKTFHFYYWERQRSLVRLMCSFQTTEAEVDGFAQALKKIL